MAPNAVAAGMPLLLALEKPAAADFIAGARSSKAATLRLFAR
jgi:hypothetical protein